MTTEKQIQANRANAKKSTGPRTAEGKARSARNAVTHGLSAESILIPGESAEEYEAFAAAMWEELQPQGAQEEAALEAVISGLWRQRRVWRFEPCVIRAAIAERAEQKRRQPKLYADLPELDAGGVIALLLTEGDTYGKIDRHEAHLDRGLYRALAEFRELQRERREREAEDRLRAQGTRN